MPFITKTACWEGAFSNPVSDEPTIASLASAAGQGAVALIRMSGAASLDVLSRCAGQGLSSRLTARHATLCRLSAADGSALDQVLVTWFRGPASYTGEDVVEIACHGGMFVARRVLERLFACGAQPAEPGEFTRRAFLNGKMDLTQAEAVMDLISASSDLAIKAAGEQLDGAIGRGVAAMCDALVGALAHVEACIDFPDEDIAPDTVAELAGRIRRIETTIARLLATADQGRLLREGIKTAIVGRPNAGKSSLLNLLLGYERAIVSEIEGTTRDTVEETIHLGGLALRLIDTAGLRESDDAVERAGIERTIRAVDAADLIIEVVDASRRPDGTDHVPVAAGAPRLLVLNKCDRGMDAGWEQADGIRFSCLDGSGLDALQQALVKLFTDKIHPSEDVSLASVNARHQACLQAAAASLALAAASLERGESPELSALELREALDHLGEITGRVDTEDVLGAIFSTFCIGK